MSKPNSYFMRKIISASEAEITLKPHYQTIIDCVFEGFRDYLKVSQTKDELETYTELKIRTKANLLHDHISSHIRKHFGSLPNIQAEEFKGIFALQIGNVFIRFKKISIARFTGSNVRTKQTKDYYKQLIIEGFPDEPTLLFLGYEPDTLFSAIENVYLVCRIDDKIEWIVDLISKIALEQSSFIFNPEEFTLEEAKVRIKEGLNQKDKTGTDNQ